MREDTYICDRCGKRAADGGIDWLRIERVGPFLRYSDPLAQERDFCSNKCAAEWLAK